MKLVSFDALRSMNIPGVTYLKPETMFDNRDKVEMADWILFPEHWQVNALVYALRKRIFPSAASYHLGHNKVEMTRAVQAAFPDHMPYTMIMPSEPSSVERILDEMPFPFVAKEIKNSMGRGVLLINSAEEFRRHAESNDTLYVQEWLPVKKDLRVVIIGRRAILSYWRVAAEGSFHNNVARGGSISFEDIPSDAVALAEKMALAFGVDHAGFDMAVVDGQVYFFEFNTKFGNEALNMRGVDLGGVIYEHLKSEG